MRPKFLILATTLALAGCQNGGIPSLGISGCELGGMGLGAVGGALAGGLIGHNWTGVAVGAAVGTAAGWVATKAFAEQLGCTDKKRLVQTTQQAAVVPTNHHVAFRSEPDSTGHSVSGYVMPVSNWHTDADGRQVRTVRQVLTDGHNTQTSTIQVASNDIDTTQGSSSNYVLPR
jgi:hypothetical protein